MQTLTTLPKGARPYTHLRDLTLLRDRDGYYYITGRNISTGHAKAKVLTLMNPNANKEYVARMWHTFTKQPLPTS